MLCFVYCTSFHLVQHVLNTATEACGSPGVHDRAYIYWRILSTDTQAAKVRPIYTMSIGALAYTLLRQSVILAHWPPISLPRTTVACALLNELFVEISSLASVYQKPVATSTFISQGSFGVESMQHRGAE